MSDISDITFYHGTSARSAAALLRGETNEWFHSMCRALAVDLWAALRPYSPTFLGLAGLFDQAGIENATAAPLGLQQLVEGYVKSSFSYGPFWVTTSFSSAADYALWNKAGSEAIQFLHDGLTFLERQGDPSAKSLLLNHPEFERIVGHRHEPTVLSMTIEDGRILTNQNNGEVDWDRIRIMLELAGTGEITFPLGFQMSSPSDARFLSVYDLSGYSAERPPSISDARAVTPSDWIGRVPSRRVPG